MGDVVLGVLAAALAGYGAFLVYTAVVFGWRGVGPGPRVGLRRRRRTAQDWLRQAGLDHVRPAEFAATAAVLFVVGAIVAFALFGGVLPSLVAGIFAAGLPVASYRSRRARRLVAAREGWPRMLEELRLLTGSLGRSVPQALFEVGRRAPVELRSGFGAAEREWLLSTDFVRTLDVLKEALADPTADAVCETLLIAHEVGGSELERRLADLVEDRIADLQGRRDAEVKQAGVRFARRFVLVVPLGMALAGLSIGTGRSAYETPGGQLAVAIGLVGVVACWVWSGRLMRLPVEPRVFATPSGPEATSETVLADAATGGLGGVAPESVGSQALPEHLAVGDSRPVGPRGRS
jgi:tight adherence protein B